MYVRSLSISGRSIAVLRFAVPGLCTCSLAVALGGCGTGLFPAAGEDFRPTLNLSALGAEADNAHFEDAANNVFESAEFVEISSEPRLIFGSIDGAGDVDVYGLGPVEPGDHVVVTVETDATLDGAVGLFDESGTALLVDDHRNVYLGRAEPYIDVTIRRPSAASYLAVAAAPGFGSRGDYTLSVSRQPGQPIPATRSDDVLLVFDGGLDVRIGGRPAVDVPPFDGESIASMFEGMTDSLMARIVAKVRADYDGLDVAIHSTSEGTQWDRGMTRVFFGTFDEALLGIAQGVDEFNSIKSQSAIVFTDTFEAFTPLNPSVEQMAQAIANVASHEIGHLFGLVHTNDPAGLMDVTAGLAELMEDQTFRRSPIYRAVFPLGYQDEVQSLLDSVGGDPTRINLSKPLETRDWVRAMPRSNPPPTRPLKPFSTCALHCGQRRPFTN